MPAPTFDYEQIDLDYNAPITRDVVRKFLIRLARSSAKLIRLDAIAYTTFEVGTNCFFLEPQIRELLDWLSDLTTTFDTDVLPEVHEHYSYPLKLAEKGYWSYDFARPLLVLNTRYHHTNQKLSE